MEQFDNVDFGSDKTMTRMIKKAKEDRIALIWEMEKYLRGKGEENAARLLMYKAQDEGKEI